ncbi:MAG TPA: hypothetical protein VFK47_11305, partial [Ktedonobacteraceae bacterium]|nr:hypothetical protein [Ktedonobacteraceae bacterium]
MAEMYQEAGRAVQLAPAPRYPERDRGAVNYEGKMASNPERRGPLRFEEGLATDTDVPNDFQVGAMSGYRTAPGKPNHNLPVWIKTPAETMRARAHAGSAAWIDSAGMTGEFMHGVNV